MYEPDQRRAGLWQDVLGRVGDRIDVSSLRMWFEVTTGVGLEADALIVAVPNTFAEEYIATRFKDILDEELHSLLSSTAEVRLAIGRVAPHNRDGTALGSHAAPAHEGVVASEDAGLRGKRSPSPSHSQPGFCGFRVLCVEIAGLSDPSKRASHAERTRPCINEHDILCN